MDIHFKLTGLTPLLMHQDDIDGRDSLAEWRKNPKNKGVSKAGDDRSPAWTWQTYCYHDEEQLVIPADVLMACLRTAGTQLTLKGKKSLKSATQSGMLVRDEFMTFRCANKAKAPMQSVTWQDIVDLHDEDFKTQSTSVKDLGFSLHLKPATVNRQKHIRVRPKFSYWEVEGDLLVTVPELTFDIVTQLFDIAGKTCGLCDWRPSSNKPGSYGMFEAELSKSKG